MGFRAVAFATALAGLVPGCGGDGAPGPGGGSAPDGGASFGADAGAPGAEVEVARCDTPIGGVPWDGANVPEAMPGVAAELAAMDVGAMPATVSIDGMPGLFRGFVAYALNRDPGQLGGELDRDAVLAQGEMGRVVLASLMSGEGTPLGIDFELFRRGFHRFYACQRQLPLTLDGFRAAVWDYAAQEAVPVESRVKCTTRRLRVNPELGVFVAETVIDDQVRETEILWATDRPGGQLDFLAYDAAGELSDRSVFPTASGSSAVAAAPYACMGCHLDAPAGDGSPATFALVHPTAGVCAP